MSDSAMSDSDLPDSALPAVYLLPGRDKRLRGGHPWVYSNELRIDAAAKALPPGAAVVLHRVDGKPLGVGTFNAHCLIAFRLFDRDPATALDAAFLAGRLRRALALRERLYDVPFYRLVHAESDGLPGLVVDRYGEVVVLQSSTAGMDALQQPLLEAVQTVLAPRAVVLRNDAPFRKTEGLDSEVRVAHGTVDGSVTVEEGGVRFPVDPLAGQKTGWFFDQRDNRRFVAGLARGGRVLDVYCHTGGFSVSAAAAGAASVLGIDRSEPALALAAEAAALNGVGEACSFRRGDAFEELERLAADKQRFEVVVADPPAFVKSRRDLNAGLRGYRKLARLAAERVTAGGILFIASCSHNVEMAAFIEETARGLASAGRSGRLIRSAGAGADHPVHPHLPETAYLKGLVYALD